MVKSNLFYRVVSAVILIPITLLMIFKAPTTVMFVLLSIITLGSVLEFTQILKITGKERISLLITSIFLLIVSCYWNEQLPIILAILFCVVSSFLLFEKGYENIVAILGTHFFCLLYIPFLLSFSFKLLEIENGRLWLFYLLLVNWLTDSFAYFVGTEFGKHKLTYISPKKSIEGLFGGVLGGVSASILINVFFFKSERWFFIIILGVLGTLFAQTGDILESGIKRSAGVKDSGTIIPGHGGFLDRFDGMFFTGLLFYIFAKFKVII